MIETLVDVRNARVKITAKCAFGRREGLKSIRACTASYRLDLDTLIWTRGEAFPVSLLTERLKCSRCGSRKVALLFDLPTEPMAARA